MKQFIIVCIVVAVAFAKVKQEFYDDDFESELFDGTEDTKKPILNDLRVQCLKNIIDELSEAKLDEDDWFSKCKESIFNLLDKLNECTHKNGLKKAWCMTKLSASAGTFYVKYNSKLPKTLGCIKDLAYDIIAPKPNSYDNSNEYTDKINYL